MKINGIMDRRQNDEKPIYQLIILKLIRFPEEN